ncbi:MAG: hypothetical protein AAGH15_16060 [Myxococcota bacterium]
MMNLSKLPRPFAPFALALGLAVAGPVGLSAIASAQPGEGARMGQGHGHGHGHGHGRRGGHGHPLRRLLSQLDLSESQQAQVRAIMEDARERRGEIARLPAGPERVEARHALRRETRRLIREVLTPEQRRQAEALKEEAMRDRVTQRVDRMTRHLELSAAQAQQVEALFLREAEARRAAMEAGSGPPAPEERAARRDAMRSQLAAILTPEQMEKVDAFMERRGERRGERGDRRGRRGGRKR